MSDRTGNCPCKVSTIFVFDSPQVQNAANTVYVQKQASDAVASTIAAGSGKPPVLYQFKTDRERMQYLLGLYGRTSQGLRNTF
jgi:hypothetical protein